jgi:hypothetical protein
MQGLYLELTSNFAIGSIKKAVDNETIVLYKRLIFTEDENPWMIAKS